MRAPVRLLLASTSRYRRELLARLGLEVECVAPPYDEERELEALGLLTPAEIALAHARGKACSVAALHPDALVLGSDQVIALGDEVLHKPVTPERARTQLERLAGRTHQSFTGVAVCHGAAGRELAELDVHTLALRALSPAQIARYVERDAPLDCAGSYRVESLGIALFERLEGADYTGVIGLPLTRVVALLARFGVDPLGEP